MQKKVIVQSCRSLLVKDGVPWVKKVSEDYFDVTQGSFSGAEVCELVGLFLLSQITEIVPSHLVGIYRDDGVMITDARPRSAEKLKKQLCEIFSRNGLSLEAQANVKIINFLDVTFDLGRGIFKPYRKPNDETNYVNAKSNHPPKILKNIPLNVNKRLVSISSNQEVFNSAAPPYQEALDRAGYNHKLEFVEVEANTNVNERRKRKRKRDIIYFNPPFNMNVETKIGREFLKIVDNSFPVGNPLHGKLTRHNVKLSYSTVNNMKAQISQHNSRLRHGDVAEVPAPCPHTRTVPCPMPGSGECNKDNVVYNAKVISDGGQTVQTYIGCSQNFADRYYKHRSDFMNPKTKHATTLSTYVWELKDQGKDFDISWKIIDRGPLFNHASKRCRLCIKESFYILYKPELATLNRRNEVFHVCHHRLTQTLRNLK